MEPLLPLLLLVLLLGFSSLALLLLLSRRRQRRPSETLPPPAAEGVADERESGGDLERKRKKKGKKRRSGGTETAAEAAVAVVVVVKESEDSTYPFTSPSSATQRKIRKRYDELVVSNEAKALTVAQVGQFIDCLVEARKDLQQKSQIIHRKFTIAKALLHKADRPSFCRLCQQIHKLEAEQKRLEEDAVVYARIQQQLKLSPAYKTMLDTSTRMEAKADTDRSADATDSEFNEISFEELLAQEKKDTFWQKNGKMRSCTR